MKIVTIVGARPQFIKAATVSRAIVALSPMAHGPSPITEVLIHTGQHFDANMSDVFFQELDIRKPDYNLGIGGGTHGQNTGRMIEAIEAVLLKEKPDWTLVYGDTDSTLAGTLAAAKLHIPVAHVEAGLRSFNRRMPEEINRVLTDHASNLLFAPTKTAIDNLRQEGFTNIAQNGNLFQPSQPLQPLQHPQVVNIGDVMYDAVLHYRDRARKPESVELSEGDPFFLCTIHRAENTDDTHRLTAIIHLLNQLALDTPIVLPLHPRTSAAIQRLGGVRLSSEVKAIQPVGYLEMTWLLAHCQLVITDSGGLQKEAYFHGKPCVTLRDETEWVELVDAGWNRLVSPLAERAMADVLRMSARVRSEVHGLYGDGMAAGRIVSWLS